jgi:Cid1 family poly A polymerase
MLSPSFSSHNSNNPFQIPYTSNLVGQYTLFDSFGVNPFALYPNRSRASERFFWKMEYSHDFIWTFSAESATESARGAAVSTGSVVKRLPLLPTTEKLLQVLQHPIPSASPAMDDDSIHKSSNTTDLNDDDSALSSSIEQASDKYAKLQHVQNLTDVILRALTDLRTIRRQNATSSAESKSGGSQRHRRKKKHGETEKKGEETHAPVSRDSVDIAVTLGELHLDEIDNDDFDRLDGETDNTESHDNSTVPLAWWILAAAFNSLRLITPLILNMVWHEHRNDINLQIGSIKLEKEEDKRRAKCWLIGTNVFDVCTVRQCELIWQQLHDMYHLLGVPTSDVVTGKTKTAEQLQHVTTLYRNLLTVSMKQLVTGCSAATASFTSHITLGSILPTLTLNYNRVNSPVSATPSWLHQHPFDEMDEKDQLKLRAVASSVDINNGLVQTNLPNGNCRKDVDEKAAYVKAIRKLHSDLSTLLTKRFPGARLSIYGSCLSDLSLGKNADVDLSLYIEELAYSKDEYEAGRITEEAYRSVVKKYVYKTFHILEGQRNKRFCKMQPVTRARVPVVKGTCLHAGNPHAPDSSLDFDICFINDIAVSNSELIRQYSLVSDTVKSVMIAVKRWAKAQKISSSQDNTISSYAWMNLVVFYLQCLGYVPNLQCRDLFQAVKGANTPSKDYWDTVNNLDTRFLTWDEASTVWKVPENRKDVSVTTLLYGFFEFYTKRFPTALFTISIRNGASLMPKPKTSFERASFFWCIEDPFEIAESYCPHDLGMHANESGACTIVRCMRTAEAFLRKELLLALDMEINSDVAVPSIESLWSDKPAEPSKKSKDRPPPRNGGSRPPTAAVTPNTPIAKPSVATAPKNGTTEATSSSIKKRYPRKKPPATANMNGNATLLNGVVAAEGTRTKLNGGQNRRRRGGGGDRKPQTKPPQREPQLVSNSN